MRVLNLIPSISPLRGGPSVAALEMAAALRARGVDACILTTNDDGPGVDAQMPLGEWFEHQGVPVIAFQRWSPPLRPLREFAISPGLNRWLSKHLSDYQLLHVHALFSWPSTTAMLQARRAQVPYVLSTIGQLNHWSLSQSASRKRLLWQLIERRNLAGAAALHFTTEEERDQAAAMKLPTPAWVVPLGVAIPPEPKPFPHSGSTTTFLFLSRIHPKKQIERLLEALALLQERLPDAAWQLQIAGNGDAAYLAALQQQSEKLGINRRCHWLGFLEGEAKWGALQAADWFVLPSASENFGIAAVEAIAAGTPPILSPDVAVASAIGAAGAGVISASDPQPLSMALQAALGGPPDSMRLAARNLASTSFSWPVIASQLHQAYSSLLESNSSP